MAEAEGEAEKRFCAENTRFSKDLEKTEGTVRKRKICLPTYPLS